MSVPSKLLLRSGQALLVAAFFILIVYFLRKDSANLSNALLLSVADLFWIGLWLLLTYISYAYSVFLILRKLGLKRLAFLDWARIDFASRFVNFFVIQGGNLFRLLMLKKRYGFAYAHTIGTTATLTWLNATMMLTLCSAGISIFGVVETGLRHQIWMATAAVWLLPAGAWLAFAFVRRLPDRLDWFRRHLQSAAAVFSRVASSPALATGLVGLSAMHSAFFIAVNFVAFNALANDVSLAEVLVFTTAISFTRYVNIVPANIGLAELIGGLVAQVLGAGFTDGLIVVGVIRVIEFLLIVAMALLDGNARIFAFIRDNRSVNAG